MRTLANVFAPPKTPLLPQRRLLWSFSPGRVVDRGQAAHATLAFRGLRGATTPGSARARQADRLVPCGQHRHCSFVNTYAAEARRDPIGICCAKMPTLRSD